ncbi:MAG TPA: HepT-like ribonuclease domain-containing protein [Bryobacteraceae bacterium]|nr:HepT-like ribonuclease domain-containing protein [Bryobacteraceae bacterium]
MRHRIVHAYFELDWQILWDAATIDIPTLRRQVIDILRTEFPESESDGKLPQVH